MARLRLVDAWLNKFGGWSSTAANGLAHDKQSMMARLDDRCGKNRGGLTTAVKQGVDISVNERREVSGI
uniref:Uncharacterized protein n=1 Tax=Cucumis melo TaxID=3656 RepID=A0A9I9CFN5_CUCME